MQIELVVPILAGLCGAMLLRKWNSGKRKDPMILSSGVARIAFGIGYAVTSYYCPVGSLQWAEPGATLIFLLELSNHLLTVQRASRTHDHQ